MAVVLRSVFAGAADVALRLTGARPADPTSHARLLNLVDGLASNTEIEAVLMESYPDLFSTSEQIARFVRSELYRSTR